MSGVSERTKLLMAQAAQRRWLAMSEEEKEALASEISSAMKSHWATKTREQRIAIAKKAAATRRANRLGGKK